MPQISINHLAVLLAAVINMGIGAFWYSPALFGKTWMALSGISMDKVGEAKKKGMAKAYIIAFVGAALMSCALARVIGYAGVSTLSAGMQVGLMAWLGFVAPVTLGSVLWEGKSWKLWLLNNAYYALVLLIAGAVLAIWK